MANEVKWTALSSVVNSILGAGVAPTAKNLANDARKLGDEYNNAANKKRWAACQLKCRGAAAFSAGGYVELYIVPALDGTNYADGGDSVTPPACQLVGVFPVRAVDTQQVVTITGIQIPPCKFKPLIINKTGQAFTNTDAENLLDMYLYDEEIQ